MLWYWLRFAVCSIYKVGSEPGWFAIVVTIVAIVVAAAALLLT